MPTSTPAVRQAGIRVVDDAGDTVRLAAPARRVVSLIPASTELLFAIGADSAVVGRTSYCDYPAAAKAVPDLGDGIKPNIEAVLASRPDLVVLYNSGQNAAVAGRLRELGIAALRINTDALSSVPRVARMLGRLTGREQVADSLAAVFDTALASATQPPTARRPKVLLLVWEQPPMTIGRGSFLSELVERAGGENLFADVTVVLRRREHRGGGGAQPGSDLHHGRGPLRLRQPPGVAGRARGARTSLPPRERLRVQPAEPSGTSRRSASSARS